jgi:hypothetical protein
MRTGCAVTPFLLLWCATASAQAPAGVDTFFAPDNAAVQISFVRDAAGAVTRLILRLGGTDVPARRIP